MENKVELKVGDTVILKSDSYLSYPVLMTVNEIDMDKVTCVWSAKDRTFLERSFSMDALQLYKGE